MWKKKPKAPQDKPARKGGPVKALQRGFFHLFNDKRPLTRTLFVGMMASVPAAGMVGLSQEHPSDARGPNGAAAAAAYSAQFNTLARDSHTVRISNEQSIMLEARAMELAARLSLDTNISEQDAVRISRAFLRDMQDDRFSDFIRQTYRDFADKGQFLEEARADALKNQGYGRMDAGDRANLVVGELHQMPAHEYGDFMMYYFIFFSSMQGVALGLLRRGTKRDNQLKQEKRNDTFASHKNELADLLAPKGASTPRPPAPPQDKPYRK